MFQPSLHGWPFPNEYAITGPDLGIGAPPPEELGLGGGMCWAALDRYLRGVEIPKDASAPEPGDPLHREFVQRQVAAVGGVWPRVREWQAEPDGSWRDRFPIPVGLGGSDVASRTRSEWRTLRRRLKKSEPVLLTVLLPAGGYRRPRAARQVLATGWSKKGQRVTLSIYDPDRPGEDDTHLAFSLAGELEARLSGGVRIRGFFTVPYDRTPAPVIRTEAFDDRSVLGLRRTVRGRAAPAAGRKDIHLVARSDTGALLHFRRPRGGHWEGVNVTEAYDFGAHELHSDPVALHSFGALHAFGSDYVGDLLHFRRRGRRWSVRNCTDSKKAGARFRLDGPAYPVGGSRGELNVLGRDSSGGLVLYEYQPLRGWRAEQVPGDPVACDPVAARTDDALHVVAMARDGRLLHWVRDEEWAMTDAEAGPGPSVRFQDPPFLAVHDSVVYVAGRDREDQLAVLRLEDEGVWERTMLVDGLAGRPQLVRGPAGIHALAPTAEGGLAHAWRELGEWMAEDVVEELPTLESHGEGAAELACWGSETELRAFTRRGSLLRVFTWTPDADWATDTVTDRVGDPPRAFQDSAGGHHLVCTDGRGTVIHVETGEWREPKREAAKAARARATARTAATQAAARARAEKRGARPDATRPPAEEEPEPLPGLEPDLDAEPGPEGEADLQQAEPGTPEEPLPAAGADPGEEALPERVATVESEARKPGGDDMSVEGLEIERFPGDAEPADTDELADLDVSTEVTTETGGAEEPAGEDDRMDLPEFDVGGLDLDEPDTADEPEPDQVAEEIEPLTDIEPEAPELDVELEEAAAEPGEIETEPASAEAETEEPAAEAEEPEPWEPDLALAEPEAAGAQEPVAEEPEAAEAEAEERAGDEEPEPDEAVAATDMAESEGEAAEAESGEEEKPSALEGLPGVELTDEDEDTTKRKRRRDSDDDLKPPAGLPPLE